MQSKNKVFRLVIALCMLFISIWLYFLSGSKNLMNVIYEMPKESSPSVLTSNGESSSIFQHLVKLKNNTFYLMSATVSGLPLVNLDLYAPQYDYDSAEQELFIPEGNKDRYYFQGLINSHNIPNGDIYFRAFFKSNNDVVIHDIALYEVGIKNQLVRYLSIILFSFSIIFLVKIVYKKN